MPRLRVAVTTCGRCPVQRWSHAQPPHRIGIPRGLPLSPGATCRDCSRSALHLHHTQGHSCTSGSFSSAESFEIITAESTQPSNSICMWPSSNGPVLASVQTIPPSRTEARRHPGQCLRAGQALQQAPGLPVHLASSALLQRPARTAAGGMPGCCTSAGGRPPAHQAGPSLKGSGQGPWTTFARLWTLSCAIVRYLPLSGMSGQCSCERVLVGMELEGHVNMHVNMRVRVSVIMHFVRTTDQGRLSGTQECNPATGWGPATCMVATDALPAGISCSWDTAGCEGSAEAALPLGNSRSTAAHSGASLSAAE